MHRFLSHIIILMVALILAVPGAPSPTPWEVGRNVKSPRVSLPQEPVKLLHAATSLKIVDDALPVPEMTVLVVPRTDESFIAPCARPKLAEIPLPSSARASPASA